MDNPSRQALRGSNDLLLTKFTPPQPGADLLHRATLLARLDEALGARLIVVAAPPGFGKTSLVSEWLMHLQAQSAPQSARPHTAWLTLDTNDNDPARFLHYVIAACQTFDPTLGQAALGMLRSPARPSVFDIANVFINDLALHDDACVLVLEDYHLITAAPVHELMAYLLDHVPAMLHLLLINRSDPPLPLARLRARDQLREISSEDLRFTAQEAEQFAQLALRVPLPPDVLARLDARLEGWPAGWRMLALLAQRGRSPQDIERIAAGFGGQHQHVLEYFVTEVFAAQPLHMQDFLLRTAFLKRFTPALCDGVIGHNDSAAQLEQLERANLFVQRISPDQQKGLMRAELWYRYHSLFAEAMQSLARLRLSVAEQRDVFVRASAWFETNGYLAEAIDLALEAGQSDRAAVLLSYLLERGRFLELATLRNWLVQLSKGCILF